MSSLTVLPYGRAVQAHARGRRAALCVRGARALTGGGCESLGPLALFGVSGATAVVTPMVNSAAMDPDGGVSATAVALSHEGTEALCAENVANKVGLFGTQDLAPLLVVAECHCAVRALALSRDDQTL
jgi:hypothetical protein